MANKRKFENAEEFAKAIDNYFNSISAEETVTRMEHGGFDDKGKPIFIPKVVNNRNGEPLKRIVWCVAPSITGLCIALGISPKTFGEYAAKGGEYGKAALKARYTVYAYLEEARSNPDTRNVKGVSLAMDALAASIDAENKPKEKPMSRSELEDALRRAFENGFFSDGNDGDEEEYGADEE